MSPTIRALQTELQNLLDYLIKSELAIYVRPIRNKSGVLTWNPFSGTSSLLLDRRVDCPKHYRYLVEHGHYSAVLHDGSLLQVTYEYIDNLIMKHRLAYVPPPFEMDRSLLIEEPLLDVFDVYVSGDADNVLLRSPLRFDFDSEAARPRHPASHLTLNSSDCRIPCAAPLRLGHFIGFVFQYFFSDDWIAHDYLRNLSRTSWGSRTLTEEERGDLHISWQVV